LFDSTEAEQLAMPEKQLYWATKWCDKVAQLCCMSDMGLRVWQQTAGCFGSVFMSL